MFSHRSQQHSCLQGVLPFLSGGFLAMAWFVFIDAVVIHPVTQRNPELEYAHFIPGILAMVGLLMAFVTPMEHFADNNWATLGEASHACTRLWLFTSFVVSFASICLSFVVYSVIRATNVAEVSVVNVTVGSVGNSNHAWVGVATILQTTLIFVSGMVWMSVRLSRYADSGSTITMY